jgi:hypothetical protein
MHWLLVRLLSAVPEAIPAGEIRAVLESRFDAAALAAEARFIADPDNRNRERPYGWGWGLALVHELGRLGRPGRAPLVGPLRPVAAGAGGQLPRLAPARHAAAALPHAVGDDYMVDHWLAAYAVLLLS